jgi:ribosomal-protein-alanine N-acetyltransferase
MRKPKVLNLPEDWNEFPAEDLRIERMTIADLDEVMTIENSSFSSPWSRNYFVQEIEKNPLSLPFLLRKNEMGAFSIIGFCVCWIIRDELHINNVAVRPSYRKRGYGEMLMRTALQFGLLQSCKKATLEVRVSNKGAIRLYEKLGFRIIGEAPNYYDDNSEDAFILFKELAASG